MGGSEQRARERLGVRVRVGFKKLDFEGPVEFSQMEERGRRSQLNRRNKGKRMGVDLAPSKRGTSLV